MPGRLLVQVLEQSEQVQALIQESTEVLFSANTVIQQELADSDPRPEAKQALNRNEAVARKLQVASEQLKSVHQALQGEIRDRTMVDHQLAAAMEQEEGSRHAALHDHLTGLPNRMLFADRLQHGIAHAKRHGCILSVMFVDLDKFKGINDKYGHQAGDEVLRTVAVRLAHSTRNDDTISRHGGDEFLCLLTPLHDRDDIAMIAAKLLEAIQAPCDVLAGDVTITLRIEASIGISVFPKDGTNAAAFIERADEAMYRAKENENRIAFARAEPAGEACAVTYRLPRATGTTMRRCSTSS